MITRTGTITTTTMSRVRIRCRNRGASRTVVATTKRIIRYGFVELLDDVELVARSGYRSVRCAVVAIPAQLFDGMWGGGIASMVLMLDLEHPSLHLRFLLHTHGGPRWLSKAESRRPFVFLLPPGRPRTSAASSCC